MPDEDPRFRHERLPIKLIMPKQGSERRVKGGGPPATPFRTVDEKYRRHLSNQVTELRKAIVPQIQRTGTGPIRVKLLPIAAAKSHRPENLFSAQSCPIIGAGRLGELFVKATPDGLDRLTHIIESNRSDQIIKELSCVEAIEPVTPQFRRGGRDSNEILRHSPRGKSGFISRVRLFNFGRDNDQPKLVDDFQTICRKRDIRFSQKGYSPSSFTYEIECRNVDDVESLSRVIGVRSLTQMPLIRTVRPQMFNPKPLPNLPGRNGMGGDFPVVVVVDSGVSDQVPALATWVVGRDSHVAPQYRNPDHGTFVAGLICWASELNPTIAGLDASHCGIFDLQVLPNQDPDKGDVLALLESEFLISLDAALQEHGNKYKVWNISLGTDAVCSLDEFSPLAEELDNLQEKYQVSFVISAGNYDTPPLLDFPRTKPQLDAGRITTPADSVLGVTVGSVSHVDYKKNGPKEHHPSAFSRHGTGPNHIIKPDLIHYGGSCSTNFTHIPLLAIHSLARRGTRSNLASADRKRIISEVPHTVVPLQQRVRQLAVALDGGGPIISGTRVAWVLETQKCAGEQYWRTLDLMEPSWIEDRYDAALGDFARPPESARAPDGIELSRF